MFVCAIIILSKWCCRLYRRWNHVNVIKYFIKDAHHCIYRYFIYFRWTNWLKGWINGHTFRPCAIAQALETIITCLTYRPLSWSTSVVLLKFPGRNYYTMISTLLFTKITYQQTFISSDPNIKLLVLQFDDTNLL